MPRDIRGSRRIRLDMASERGRTSRPIRISWRRERCRRAWCWPSNLGFFGGGAGGCAWEKIFLGGGKGGGKFLRIPAVFCAEKKKFEAPCRGGARVYEGGGCYG